MANRATFVSSLFLVLLTCSLAAAAAPAAPAAPADRPPNIIFILADDLGYGDLACYGNKFIKTPNVDRMAAEGMRFTQAYAGSTVCSPSRAVLMTGLHTGHGYQRANDGKNFRQQDATIAKVLKSAGYTTGIIGKWGLGGPKSNGIPTKLGFDSFYGYLGNSPAHNFYPPFLWRNEQKEQLPNEVAPGAKANDGRGVATKKGRYSNDAFRDEALAFLDAHKDKTFFLYLPFTIPHANNEASKATGNGSEVPDLGEYAKADWPAPVKGHAAMVSRLDGYVGEIFDRLKKLGIDDNTIVFFTSDNGPHKEAGPGYDPKTLGASGPLRGIKRDLYEGGVREPFIVRWPGRVAAGKTTDQITWFPDVLPTLAEIAKLDPSKLPKHDGLSIVPTLLGQPDQQKQPQYLYWEFYEQGSKQAVREGNWKAIRMPMLTGKTELYDLKSDLSESKNVAAEHPDVVKHMEELMAAAHTPPTDPSAKERVGAKGAGNSEE
jgi:arylsulfatase A-like enzyme